MTEFSLTPYLLEERIFIGLYLIVSIIFMLGFIVRMPSVVVLFQMSLPSYQVSLELMADIIVVDGFKLTKSRCHGRRMPAGLVVPSSQNLLSLGLAWLWIVMLKFPYWGLPLGYHHIGCLREEHRGCLMFYVFPLMFVIRVCQIRD